MNFSELNLDADLLTALDHMGFHEATPIQEQAIPLILAKNDLIACAQTGTGKTGAFLLPILNALVGKEDTSIAALVIVPTRELALQIENQIQGLSYFISVGSYPIYGGGDGKNWDEQKRILKEGTDIIIATPGKLLSHIAMGNVNFKNLKFLVLDEADKMLDMGFSDDIHQIISKLPTERQTLMFSATMPPKIHNLAKKILKQPKEISLSVSKPAEGIIQQVCLVFDQQKKDVLNYIVSLKPEFTSIIIFTSSKNQVSEIVYQLKKAGHASKGMSSNLEQSEREEVLAKFRSKKVRILVATDVMSRGIDIKDINMVINYDAPSDAEDYVHRIGRTARANTTGEAFTLINEKDMRRFARIEQLIEMEVPRFVLPEEFGPQPEWKIQSQSNPKKKFKFKKKNNNNKEGNHKRS